MRCANGRRSPTASARTSRRSIATRKSVVLDLKDAECAAIARRLVLDSDVVVENNRPGVMDRLGLGYAALAAQKPALVYCSISAFGQTGPRAAEGGFDL